MPALIVNFTADTLKEAFATVGIHLLEEFSDGGLRWGDSPPAKPYKGLSVVMAPYISFEDGKFQYDIFSIRNVAERLGRQEALVKLDQMLTGYRSKAAGADPPGKSLN
jgi:hypothetical protein